MLKARWKTSLSQMSLQLERTQQRVFQLENELSRKEKEIERLTAQLHSLQNGQEISGERVCLSVCHCHPHEHAELNNE